MTTTIIRVKRSTTSGDPSTLGDGELAYSAANYGTTNGGGRLYLGIGAETGGDAASHLVIGGQYFTDKLDHAPGTLTSGSAIIVDNNSKIDILNVDNLTLNGNTLSSTNLNGDIVLDPDGSGLISASSTRIVNIADPVNAQDAVTRGYIESGNADVYFNNIDAAGNLQVDGNLIVGGSTTTLSAQNLAVSDNMIYLNQGVESTITGASGDGADVTYTTQGHNYVIGMTVTVTGVSPSSFDVTDAEITGVSGDDFTIASTVTDTYSSGGTARAKTSTNPDLGWSAGYNDGSYAHAGFFRDASDGRFKVFDGYTPEPDLDVFLDTTHASFALAEIEAENFYGELVGNASTATAWQTARDLTISGDATGTFAGVDGTANVNLALTLANTTVTAGSYGAADSVATFTVDSKGRLTAAADLAINILSSQVSDFTEAAQDAVGAAITAGQQTNITVTYDDLNNEVDYFINTATANILGVAKFSTDNFNVNAGDVTVVEVDGGGY